MCGDGLLQIMGCLWRSFDNVCQYRAILLYAWNEYDIWIKKEETKV